ncbi:MAG TPA: SOS response-associated peptidase [Candidatus Limnocylindrales bacterium]|jgi:putative SOS response-associated peptidase YedK
MCGRFAQQRPTSELAEIFDAEDLVGEALGHGGHFNVAPTDSAAVVVQRDDHRAVTAYRWGLIPHWSESAATGNRMFNARSESIDQQPAFRYAFQKRRCLVPVDAFYEWRKVEDARGKVVREPYAIARADGQPMALAGLWAGWHDEATGEVVRSFTILTTTPNDTLRPIHDRMPVVLPPATWERWLDPTRTDAPALAELKGLLVPADDAALEAYRVSRRVSDVRNDDQTLLVPFDPDGSEREPEAPLRRKAPRARPEVLGQLALSDVETDPDPEPSGRSD